MATETVATDHTSTTDEQIVKKEKDEAIEQKIISLANEDEDKHDKPEDAQCAAIATPSSKTEGEGEGDEKKAEVAVVEVEKSDDSPALDASAEDNLKYDKVEDAQSPVAPISKTEGKAEGDDKEAEPAVVVVEKTVDSVSLEADNLKEEKQLIPDSQTTSVTEPAPDAAKYQPEEPPSTEPTLKETPQQLEQEPIEKEEEKQPNTADIPPEASAETIEKSSNTAEASPLTESEAEAVKEAEILETSAQKEEKPEPEPVATEVQEKTEEPEKESREKPQEAEQPSTVAIPEPSAEANEKPSDAIEEKTTEPPAEVLKETNNDEAGPTETVKAEPVVTEVEESPKEPEKQSFEQKEEELPNSVVIPEPSAETSEAIEEKTREPEFEAEVLKETNNYEAGPTETEKAEPVVTKVDENPSEPEKQSFKQEEEEQPKTVIPETRAESAEKQGDIIGVEPPKESDIEVVKDIGNSESEAVPEKTEKPGDTVVVHPPKESDIEVVKESGNSESEAVPGKAEKPGDIVVVHPPSESAIEVVKETGNSESEAVPGKEEKPEPVSTAVEEKPREQLEVAGEVGETSKDVETKQEIVLEAAKSDGTSDDTIKDPISFKEEKTDKEEETSITGNTAHVSLNGEAQAAPANLVEPSPKVAEKVVEEDGKKESIFTGVIEGVSEEVADVIKNPEQASIDQEAKTGLKEERESSVPTSVEEKVAVAANDDKKEPEAPDAVQGSSREAEVEIKKVEEQNEAKTATTEAGGVKVESVKDERPAIDNKKEENADTKVDEISPAVIEPVRETLASKFEEKEEESTKTGVDSLGKEQIEEPVKTQVQATKESDATKTSRDLPKETLTKPAHKQSNNIISKVKQSLVKAKKAITGKSPSSKNHSSEAKDDIKVK